MNHRVLINHLFWDVISTINGLILHPQMMDGLELLRDDYPFLFEFCEQHVDPLHVDLFELKQMRQESRKRGKRWPGP